MALAAFIGHSLVDYLQIITRVDIKILSTGDDSRKNEFH